MCGVAYVALQNTLKRHVRHGVEDVGRIGNGFEEGFAERSDGDYVNKTETGVLAPM